MTVRVNDARAHCEQARPPHGARILMEPPDIEWRTECTAEDPAGQQ